MGGMLQLSEAILKRQILSLRTSAPIADIVSPIINPDNLKIEGFYCSEYSAKEPKVLLYQDIRDILPQGIVVDDFDALTDPAELIRLKKVLDKDFVLIGKPVETISHDKVGKVSDYAFETSTMYIQKLYVSRSILKNLTSGSLSIDRTQIQDVTPKKVVINDLLETVPTHATSPVSA
jgi:sporulation protein YlmC with PRC-barrel domain